MYIFENAYSTFTREMYCIKGRKNRIFGREKKVQKMTLVLCTMLMVKDASVALRIIRRWKMTERVSFYNLFRLLSLPFFSPSFFSFLSLSPSLLSFVLLSSSPLFCSLTKIEARVKVAVIFFFPSPLSYNCNFFLVCERSGCGRGRKGESASLSFLREKRKVGKKEGEKKKVRKEEREGKGQRRHEGA